MPSLYNEVALQMTVVSTFFLCPTHACMHPCIHKHTQGKKPANSEATTLLILQDLIMNLHFTGAVGY